MVVEPMLSEKTAPLAIHDRNVRLKLLHDSDLE